MSLPWKRRRAREIALQLVYELRVRPGAEAEEALASYPFEDEEDDVARYASLLVRGVAESEPALDGLIRRHMVGWRPERMVAVDRAAVELALYEGWVGCLVPVAVAISEAVELAKVFGTEDSGRFVNGVLGRIVRAESGGDADARPGGGDVAAADFEAPRPQEAAPDGVPMPSEATDAPEAEEDGPEDGARPPMGRCPDEADPSPARDADGR